MSMTIKVDTDQLRTVSGSALTQIQATENTFRTISGIIDRSLQYWEGSGQEYYRKAFQEKSDNINNILLRYRENANDLREIGGVYDETEKSVAEEADALPSDVII